MVDLERTVELAACADRAPEQPGSHGRAFAGEAALVAHLECPQEARLSRCQVATVMLDVADREQRVRDATAVRRVALSSLERAHRIRRGDVEIAEVDPEMAEVGEERFDGPLVAELLAQLERLLLQPHGALEVRAHSRELARGDAALRLDGERRAARQRQRLFAPGVRLFVPSADQPIEPGGTDDAKC